MLLRHYSYAVCSCWSAKKCLKSSACGTPKSNCKITHFIQGGMRHAALNTNLSCSNHRKFIRPTHKLPNGKLIAQFRPVWFATFCHLLGISSSPGFFALSLLPCCSFPTCSQLPPRLQGLLIKRRAKPSVASAPNDFKINPHISILMRVIFLPRLISYETYFVCSAYALAFVLVFAFAVLFLFWAVVAKWFDPWMSWPSSTVSTGAKITERNSLLDCSGKLQLSKGLWRANSLTRRDLILFVK